MIEAMLKEWSETGVRGIVFEFYTPVKGLDELRLDEDLRDAIVDRLIKLKRRYYDFILNPDRALKLLKSENSGKVTDNCLWRKKSISLDPAGKTKKPCILGPEVECKGCGCAIPFYLRAVEEKRFLLCEFSSFAGRLLLDRLDKASARLLRNE